MKYYTREGLELAQRRLVAQEAKVRGIGREAGEEATLNSGCHDNFGYEDAKRRLEMESSLLARMQDDLRGAEVVEVEEQCERAAIGSSIRLTLGEAEKVVTIGAFGESAPDLGLVSYNSPLGTTLRPYPDAQRLCGRRDRI